MATILTSQFLLAHKKLLITGLLVGALTGGMAASDTARAAIPVVDTANIAKTAEQLTQTIKVVSNTTQQVALMLKDLKNLPQSVYDKYVASAKKGDTEIANILNSHGGIYSQTVIKEFPDNKNQKVDVDKYMSVMIPALPEGSYKLNDRTAATMVAVGTLLSTNKNTMEVYQQITKALADSSQQLDDLINTSQSVEGSVQAQQVASQIAGVQARIDMYRGYLEVMDNQQKVLKAQAEAQQKKNDIDMAQNNAAANKKAIEEDSTNYQNTPGTRRAFGGGWVL